MAELIIIGNGFDLAHDLPTKFSDFLKWYFSEIKNHKIGAFNKGKPLITSIESHISPDDFIELNFNVNSITYCNNFIEKLIFGYNNANWEGVEREYYKQLLDCESITQAEQLNHCFEELRLAFIEYLKLVYKEPFSWDDSIYSHLNNIHISNFKSQEEPIIWLNFNYTPYAYYYFDRISRENKDYEKLMKFIYIHGNYSEPSSVIFGYGDESDPKYLSIEQINNNEYLKYFKSFMYLKADNYDNLIKSLYNVRYNVHIMGHSCGLSDRVLLKELFCSQKCEEIIIYYYRDKANRKNNDYIDKVMNISRVFPMENKTEMRNKIVPFTKCKALSW